MQGRGGKAAIAAAITALGAVLVTVGVGVGPSSAGPAGVDTPEVIKAQLIDQLEGYVLEPEGNYLEGVSGPVDITEAAAVAGVDVEPLLDNAGYARVFTSDEYGGSTVVVVGIDISGYDGADLLEGLAILEDLGYGPEQLWVDLEPPLDGLVSYAVAVPTEGGGVANAELSAFVADDLLVTIEARGVVVGTNTIRDVMRGQLELTQPTITPGHPAAADPHSVDDEFPSLPDDEDDGTSRLPLMSAIAAIAAIIAVLALALVARRRQRDTPSAIGEGAPRLDQPE